MTKNTERQQVNHLNSEAVTKNTIKLQVGKKIGDLINVDSSLAAEKNFPLCRATEKNFVAVLLIQQFEAKFKKLFEKKSIPPSATILNPINIEKRMQFTLRNDKNRKILVADQVLLKPAVGYDSGLIISGPYTGLILNCSPFINHQQPAEANRIWSTKKTNPTDSQYSVYLEGTKHLLPKTEFIELADEAMILLQTTYTQWALANPQLLTTTDQMIHLCKELNIPLEMDQKYI